MIGNEDTVLDFLRDAGQISEDHIASAYASISQSGASVLDVLVEMGAVSRLDVLKAVANTAGMEFVDVIEPVDDVTMQSVPKDIAYRYRIFPIYRDEGFVRVALANPFDIETVDSLNFLLKLEVEPVVAPPEEIERALGEYYGPEGQDAAPGEGGDGGEGSGIEVPSSDGDAPIIRMVQQIIQAAQRMKGSDIHIEPMEKRMRIRFRIDGVLKEIPPDPPKRLQAAIISRLKILSNMSIAEKRLPQDGRIQMEVDKKVIDLRVSSVPTTHGESIVMRILDKTSLMLGLPELGFLSDDQVIMERILGLADGIFLVTGPTGSGKTTTLYGCLNYLNKPDRKIITVEDPVEYVLKGINQVQVQEDVGMTFAAALRSMLRQAPNIIMLGEIRDLETATIAINASLTGHLVFSTLHTNDAPGAVTRLIDIGVQPFLVGSSLRAVMAQRLIRKLCPLCKEIYAPNEAELRALGIKPSQAIEANFMHPVGCEKCNGSGHKGRMGIFEIFVLNDETRRMITEKMPVTALRSRARELGMRTLREDGIRKVLAGLTSIPEVVSATVGDKD
jgi:general secretion pathway protein E/type IV pilus assembly protein PilB